MKNPAYMTNGQINSVVYTLDKKSSALTKKLIEAGFGGHRITDLQEVENNDLVTEYLGVLDRLTAMHNEVRMRMGPNWCGSGLPRGGARLRE